MPLPDDRASAHAGALGRPDHGHGRRRRLIPPGRSGSVSTRARYGPWPFPPTAGSIRRVAAITLADLKGNPSRLRKEAIVRAVLFLAAAVLSILISAGIVIALVGKAWSFFTDVDMSTLWGDNWAPRSEQFSIKALLSGTLIVTGIAMLIAAPLGLGSAIYLSEYASPRVRRTLKPILEVLAGIPSVVIGFFCVSFISPDHRAAALRLGRHVQPRSPPASASASSSIPLIASVSEDAMRSRARGAAGGELRPRRPQDHDVVAGRPARRRLRPRRRVHPRRLPGHRRDDGRAARRRLGQRVPVHAEPVRGGPDDDRRHRLADPRVRRRPSPTSSSTASTSSASCCS